MNEKAINLHLLEDVLGWVVVLIGAIVMRFTNFTLIDPLMSIGVAVFIFINAIIALEAGSPEDPEPDLFCQLSAGQQFTE